jgi:hypothetical protein
LFLSRDAYTLRASKCSEMNSIEPHEPEMFTRISSEVKTNTALRISEMSPVTKKRKEIQKSSDKKIHT